MTGRRESPPRFARALLDRLLSPSDPGSATGDLDEEYTRFVLPARGRRAADRWYWRQVILSAPSLLRARVGGKSALLASTATDVGVAVRVLRRRPGLAFASVATLGLGLGANTAVFSVVHAVLVRPLPFARADRLVRPIPGELFFLDGHEALLLDERMSTLEAFVPWGRTLFLFTSGDGAEEVRGARVGWNHFDVLGVEPALGRTFDRADASADDVVVLSHGLWVRRFGADPGVVGSTLPLFGRDVTVIGVLRPDHVPLEFDWEAWRPLPLDPDLTAGMGLAGTGLLREGATLEQARSELRTVLPDIWELDGYVASDEERASLELVRLDEWLVGDVRPTLLALTAAVTLVLLLACVNVANLLVVHGGGRDREFAVRAALGGSRLRLGRQVLAEVSVVSAAGAATALLTTGILLGWLRSRLPADLPRASEITMSAPVVTFSLVAALLVALLTAVVPAWRASGARLGSLRTAGRGAGHDPGRTRAQSLLVATEIAIAVLLVVGAGLTLRTLASLQAVDPGFDAAGVVTVRPSPPSDRYPGAPELDAYYDRLAAELARLPGVRSVGAIQFLPMTPGGWWTSYLPEGLVMAAGENAPTTAMRVVREGYFETMRIPVVVGRPLQAADGDRDGPIAAVVNEAFAGQAFPDGDVVGRTIEVSDLETVIVGVVGDVRQSDPRTRGHAEMYLPFDAVPWTRMHVVARVDDEVRAMLAAVTEAVRSVDPEVSLLGPRAMTDVVGATLGDARLLASLLTLFGAVGLVLGSVGVYGVTAQSVVERRREIGIRMALGAEGGAVARATVLAGMVPVGSGLAVGLLGALGASALLEGLLFGVPPRDPATFVVAPAVLLAVAAAALAVPAVRAARVDPVRTLRDD